MTPRRALLIVALATFSVLASFYATGYRAPYRAFFWAAGVNVTFKPYLPFADFDEVLSAIECSRKGIDVFVSDPCDPLGRPHAYSPLWLAGSLTDLGQGDLIWTGTILVLAFLVTAIGIAAPGNYGEAAIVLVALLSQASLFAMERANIDLVMFLLVVGGAMLFSRGANGRLGAYFAIFFAALLKFYPALGLGLALYERPRRFTAVAAVSILGGSLFILLEWHAFRAIWGLIPRPGPYDDAFGGINFFKFISSFISVLAPKWVTPYRSLVQTVLYMAAISAAVKVALASAPGMAKAMGGSRPMTAREAIFIAGSTVLIGIFFLADNVAYRGIWLLTILPSVLHFRRQSPPDSASHARWSTAIVFILLLLWCECFHAHVTEIAGVGAGHAFAALVREPLWWTFISGLMAMLWAQLTVVTPAVTVVAFTSAWFDLAKGRTSRF